MKKIILLLILFFAACSVESKPSSIQGKVSLAPNLANKIGPSDILYILAYPESQNASDTTPLAVRKIAPVIFPAKYEISQEDIIFPEKKFMGSMRIMAHLHKNPESAPAQKSEFEGFYKKNPVQPGSKNIDIILEIP